jgi:NAD(P)-dependent dehydrogenase (short-subunit alcohol dehydrogenase family)
LPPTQASLLLRPELLRGVSVLLAGDASEPGGSESALPALRDALAQLGARVWPCEASAAGQPSAEASIERAVSAAMADGPVHVLVVDGAGMFAAPGGGRSGLSVCLEAAWSATRVLVNAALIPGGQGGRIVYVTPAPGAGAHASAARAGLENLARTLSIEWARHRITSVAIGPGDRTSAGEVAALGAYLASEAGAYFSGCLLELAGPAPS